MTLSPLQISLLGEPVRIAAPAALPLAAVAGLVLLLGALSLWRRRRALRALAGPQAARVAPGAGLVRPGARLGLQSAGLLLLALALSRPQCGTTAELTRRYGSDLVLALDVSRSMLARDERPDRLTRARLEIGALLERLQGDRVAVVLFAADAFVQCPLTTDYAAARLLLRGAGPSSVPRQGTSLAAALRTSGQVLSAVERGGRSRAVVLLSDGEEHEAGAGEAAAALAAEGVRVFTVGIGSPEGAPLPSGDQPGRAAVRYGRDGKPIVTRLEEALLREVAERGGGRYFRAAGAVGLPELAEELGRMEKTEIEGRTTVSWEERYAVLAFPGLLLLLGGALLRQRPRVLPVEEAP
ncbi:MAG: VWA domain-containing protein [Deltaproteobacteria bacterium]|nr:VWA domain-containing protein [Deltaproteobacteria bacterium]